MKLWKQVRLVSIGKILFDFNDLDIDLDVKCTDDFKSDIAKVTIYNLSDTTKQELKKGQDVSIDAGYQDLHGVIFNGIAEDIQHKRDESDIVTVVTCTPNNRAYTNTIINSQFNAGIRASEVIRQIESMCSFKMDIKELGKDTVYPNGKVFSGRLSNIIPILARDTGTISRFTNTNIEFKLPNKAYSSVLRLSGEQGLIRVEKKQQQSEKEGKKKKETNEKKKKKKKKDDKEKYDIECLLIPIVKIGQLLEIDSTVWKGRGVVKECNYMASGVDTFSVNAVVEVIL